MNFRKIFCVFGHDYAWIRDEEGESGIYEDLTPPDVKAQLVRQILSGGSINPNLNFVIGKKVRNVSLYRCRRCGKELKYAGTPAPYL